MIKKKLLKGTVAVAVASMTLSSIFPYQPVSVIKANDAITASKVNAPVQFVKNADGTYTYGNQILKRQFSLSNGLFKTDKLINSRTGAEAKELIPAQGSEEFVITTLDNGTGEQFKAPTGRLESSGFKATADSVADNETPNGPVEKIFDNDPTTYWHSKYGGSQSSPEIALPHNISIDLGSQKTMNSFSYHKRIYGTAPTNNGHIKEYELYKFDTKESFENANEKGTLVASGSFARDNSKRVEYVNFENPVTTQYLRLVIKSAHNEGDQNNPTVTSIGDLNFYSDKAVFPKEQASVIKASQLKAKEPVFDSAKKTLTVEFETVKVRDVDYTIKAVYTMKDNEAFMRKHLEISVPEAQAEKARIDYIDLENMNFAATDTQGNGSNQAKDTNYWTIPDQPNNPDMSNQRGKYLELGQPYYVGAMYWGCEFPVSENKIREKDGVKNGFIRYHYGKNLTVKSESSDGQFNNYKNYNGANGVSGKMKTWDAVVGAARGTEYQVCQADFYEYIETIATKTDFRQQFNSWYDNMKNINNTNILESFAQVEKGFTQYGVNPLDSYVVDDGWQEAGSLWTFNTKFPNQLYDSSLQVHQMGSNFGLWLGPRGGYGETVAPLVNYLERTGKGSRNSNQHDANISDGRYLDGLTNEVFVPYQQKFDINYWKLDGMLWAPSRTEGNYHVVGQNDLYTVSETYERWTDMYERMRDQRNGVNGDLWINMTSYANPSPWFLQWVNSLWMQNTGDTGFDYKFTNRDQQSMLTYRDGDYYDFFNHNQWQLPNKYFYNHDPVYAKTAHKVPGSHGKQIEYTTDELREHLYMMGTRGTAFWEYYYSPSMFDAEKWQVNAESAKWIEENFDILQKSKMFGGNPENGDVYGYSCWNGNEGIISIRNPHNTNKQYKLKLDRLIGVTDNLPEVYGKVILGDLSYQTNTPVKYGSELTFDLKPQEAVIIQYGKKDSEKAKINSIHTKGNKVEVEFNETVREVNKEQFKVKGFTVTDTKLQADRRTVTLTLDKEPADMEKVTVTVNDVKDTVGNATTSTFADEYYKDDVICSVVDTDVNGNAIIKDKANSIDGNKGFSVVGEISTTSKNVVLAEQKGAFKVGINNEGYLTFEFNGLNINSKYDETKMNQGTPVKTTKGVINDGRKHTFAAVKEVNGMIKLYIDGKVVASGYTKENLNPTLVKEHVSFADGLKGHVNSLSLMDKALAFDDIAAYTATSENVALANKGATIKAYDNTTKSDAVVNSDKPLGNIIDGNKAQDSYGELKDTTNPSTKHSRYVEITLKDSYELNKINLTRYFDGSRKYGATVIALYEENDTKFERPLVVYNSDKENVHGLGAGNEEYYVETAQGKAIDINVANNTKVIRVYVNGRDNTTTHDHIVEVEAFGTKTSTIPTRIDYSQLQALVNVNEDAYTTSSFAKYANDKEVKKALEEAKKVLADKKETSTSNIDRLSALLQTKQEELLVARANVQPAKDALAKLEGLSKKDYTEATWNAFVDAKAAVEKVVKDNSNTSDAQLADLLAKLDAAHKALEKVTPQGGETTPTPKPETPEKPEGGDSTTPGKPESQDTTKPIDPVKPQGNKDETGTGDVTSMSMFASMLAASGVAVTAMLKRRNKK